MLIKPLNMNYFSISSILFALLISISSCNLVKDFTYTVNPNPLEMHGDSVKFTVVVNVPEKGIQKKVRAELTPKIGSSSFGTWIVQGEKVTGNGKTIFFKPGGTASFEMGVPYSANMEAADVKITGKVFKGLKEKMILPEIKIADATIVTPQLVKKEFKMVYEDDAIVRSINKSETATINFGRSQSDVNAKEIKDLDVSNLILWISSAQLNPKIKINSINIVGYASPDGIENQNVKLSNERTRTVRTALISLMKKAKIIGYEDTSSYQILGKGEDFQGFKEQLSISTTISDSDKSLFLRILDMSKDPAKREAEMLNLGKSFKKLEEDVFPKIRRAVITVEYTENGLTDDEIIQATNNNPSILGVEELLFAAANLTQDINEKARIYELASTNFNSDFRSHNNLGAVRFLQNRLQDAKSSFEKANSLIDNASSKNNLAGVYIINGDKVQAKKLLSQTKSIASKNSSLVAYNNGIINIMDGEYSKAVSNIGENCFNKALAFTLQAKLTEASKSLETITATSESLYLKAIISARNGESVDAVINNLKQAFTKDSNLKLKASKDREFIKFMNDTSFISAVK
jgi:outer membrane protein OmpA-like peptidoglycan-associated protein